jgi:hypothetical protein
LIKLFACAKILGKCIPIYKKKESQYYLNSFSSSENWETKLKAMIHKNDGHKSLAKEVYQYHYACISQFMAIFCGFVLKDYHILLNKWLKRSMCWMTE